MKQISEKLFQTEEDAAYLFFDEINRFYVTGFHSTAGAAVLLKEKSYFLTDSRYSEAASSKLAGKFEVLDVSGGYNETILGILKRAGVRSVFLENKNLLYENYVELSEAFSGFEVKKLGDRLELLRAVKDESELALIKAAQDIAEKAFEKVTSSLKVGMSERDVSVELDYQMAKFGAESVSFPTIVAFDENSSKPHCVPGDCKLKNNSVVLIDFGAKVAGYCSDTTRTFVYGKPSDEFARIYDIVLHAVGNFEKYVAAGVQCNEGDAFARELIAANGYGSQFLHSTGHGVGLEIHEFPYLNKKSQTALAENMVITCEPGIYLPGKFGIRTEDLLVVKSGGLENFTKLGKELSR